MGVRRRGACGAVPQRLPMVGAAGRAPCVLETPPTTIAMTTPAGSPFRTHGTYQRARLGSRRGSRGFASFTVEGTALQFFALEPSNGG
jgi:hypothetical protein